MGCTTAPESGQLTHGTADIRDRRSVSTAIEGAATIISALASFQPPHDPMSTLTRHIIAAAG